MPALSLGLDTFGDVTTEADGQPKLMDQVLRDVVEEAVLANELGTDFIGLGEHHRPDFAISAPEIVRDDRRHLPEGAPHGFQLAVEKGGSGSQRGRLIGRTKGGLNTKLPAVTDAEGRPIRFFLTAGHVRDHTGALALLDALPQTDWLLANKGYDAHRLREALRGWGTRACIPGRSSRGQPIRHDRRRYKRRHRIEMMFGRLEDWRRVATRCDRLARKYLASLALVSVVVA